MRFYKLVEDSSPSGLNKKVNLSLANDWDCWGNPFAIEAEFDANIINVHFFQAMVKIENEHDRIYSTSGKSQAINVAGFNVGAPEISVTHGEKYRPIGGLGMPSYQMWRKLFKQIFAGFEIRPDTNSHFHI